MSVCIKSVETDKGILGKKTNTISLKRISHDTKQNYVIVFSDSYIIK